jgi:hypothetical protein
MSVSGVSSYKVIQIILLIFSRENILVIAQKPMASFKEVVRHRIAFFKIKSIYPSDLQKTSHNANMNFVPNFMFTLYIN